MQVLSNKDLKTVSGGVTFEGVVKAVKDFFGFDSGPKVTIEGGSKISDCTITQTNSVVTKVCKETSVSLSASISFKPASFSHMAYEYSHGSTLREKDI